MTRNQGEDPERRHAAGAKPPDPNGYDDAFSLEERQRFHQREKQIGLKDPDVPGNLWGNGLEVRLGESNQPRVGITEEGVD